MGQGSGSRRLTAVKTPRCEHLRFPFETIGTLVTLQESAQPGEYARVNGGDACCKVRAPSVPIRDNRNSSHFARDSSWRQ
ncbi:hypothetical protein UY3_03561 [Chelonia mydas]|uniref:Uncharacterized protein n=1 Tax=Chelonia mydas TaxID=8469 RepID=M7BMS0_CHEMY|nr:hypothetical protein UY3_03561 [Chelonia mydas]